MFEAEVELEKKSSFGPLILVIALLATILGLVAYVFMQSRQHLAPAEAAQMVTSLLHAQGPATVQFHGGMVVASVNDRPTDPHYRLLEKAGLLKIGKQQGRATPILATAVAWNSVSDNLSSCSQPGMQALSVTGSLSFSQTVSRGTAS